MLHNKNNKFHLMSTGLSFDVKCYNDFVFFLCFDYIIHGVIHRLTIKKTTELGINLQRSDVQSKLLRSPLESVPLCCNFALSGLLYILNRNYWHFACERCCVRYFLPPELIKTLKCSYYPGIWFLLF